MKNILDIKGQRLKATGLRKMCIIVNIDVEHVCFNASANTIYNHIWKIERFWILVEVLIPCKLSKLVQLHTHTHILFKLYLHFIKTNKPIKSECNVGLLTYHMPLSHWGRKRIISIQEFLPIFLLTNCGLLTWSVAWEGLKSHS